MRTVGRRRRRLEDNTKMVLKVIGCYDVYWIQLCCGHGNNISGSRPGISWSPSQEGLFHTVG
jgi:hypothetical protein